jgi:hypothetical protein
LCSLKVSEDPSLLQHIKASLLELSKPVCSDKSSSAPPKGDDDRDPMCAKVNHEIVDTLALENLYSSSEEIKFDQEGINEVGGTVHEEINMDSPDECSNGCEHNYWTEDSFMPEGINGGASQVQSWHLMDDDFSNGVQDSMNSSDCISEAFVNQEKTISTPKQENVTPSHLQELQNSNYTKLGSLDLGADDDLHYKRILSAILGSSPQLIENPCFHCSNCKSSFLSWKKESINDAQRPQVHQRMLKKILFTVPLMYGGCSLRSRKENGGKDFLRKLESDDICIGHILSDNRRENEKFLVLRSMVPSISEVIQFPFTGGHVNVDHEWKDHIFFSILSL